MKLRGDNPVDTVEKLQAVLKRITFKPSCVDFRWRWEVEALFHPPTLMGAGLAVPAVAHADLRGWLVNTTFRRPDTDTGKVGTGRGRQEFIAVGTSVSGVVKTCWLLVELIVRHELMEAFCFDGRRLFDPHKTVEELTAGGRP